MRRCGGVSVGVYVCGFQFSTEVVPFPIKYNRLIPKAVLVKNSLVVYRFTWSKEDRHVH